MKKNPIVHKRQRGDRFRNVVCGLLLFKYASYIRIYLPSSLYWKTVTCKRCRKKGGK